MNTIFPRVTMLVALAVFGLGALTASTAASPFVGSRKTAHATLYLNVDQRARQIWPVEIWAVDGVLSNRSDQGVLWIRPGQYTFKVRVSQRANLADVPGLAHCTSYGQAKHELRLRVHAGKIYYIGAKFQASGNWEPVVWKTANARHPVRHPKP